MSLVIDLIIVAIIAFCVFRSAKKGFVGVVVETVGFIAAIIIAFTISTPLAAVTYDKIIEPPIVAAAVKSSEEAVDVDVWESLPEFISQNAESIGISGESFYENITTNLSQGTQAAVKTASQRVIKPAAQKILGLIYSAVLVIILLIAVKFIAKIINKMFSFSIVGKANRMLGGIVGVAKGAIFAVLFCMVISVIITFTKGGFLIFTRENINNSYIFKALMDIIPFNIF